MQVWDRKDEPFACINCEMNVSGRQEECDADT